MKFIFLTTLLIFSIESSGQIYSENDTLLMNPKYDKLFAKKLGGDDYGMKNYYLVILKSGTNNTSDSRFIAQCFRGHLDNISPLRGGGETCLSRTFREK